MLLFLYKIIILFMFIFFINSIQKQSYAYLLVYQ